MLFVLGYAFNLCVSGIEKIEYRYENEGKL